MVFERPQTRSQKSSAKRKSSQSPESSAPKPPPALIPTKLVEGKRNIVGENHDQSEKRRDKEDRYFLKTIGSEKTILEDELKKPKVDSSDSDEDMRDSADPLHLKMLSSLDNVREFSEIAKAYMRSLFSSDSSSQDSLNGTLLKLKDVFPDLIRYTEEVVLMHETLENGDDGLEWIELNGEQSVKDLKPYISAFDSMHKNIKDLSKEWDSLSTEVKMNVLKQIKDHFESTNINLIIPTKAILIRNTNLGIDSTFEDISEQRSEALYEGVKDLPENKTVVIKLGDNHVKDIKKKNDKSLNVVGEKDFNAEFIPWLESEQPTTDKGKKKRHVSP